MRGPSQWLMIGRKPAVTPIIAVGIAIALLVASFALGLHNERLSRSEKIRETAVQSQILAGSLAAPLAFDDAVATREYVNALRVNPEIEAVGAYGANGRLAAGYAREGPLPQVNAVGRPSVRNGELTVTADVVQGATKLGSVYLRTTTESWQRRAVRYLGIAVVLIMASLLIAVLGASYASASDANRRLQEEIEGRRKAEEALRQSQKMEAMGQLTGGVAHDFNNLLMVASSGLDLMERASDPAKRERLKQGIREAIDRGAKLTQQLLTFARRSPLSPEVIDLASRIRGLHDLLDRSLREDIVVALDFPADLWTVQVDPSQLDVAVLNIALNARDAMPGGGTITISAQNMPAGSDDMVDMVSLSIRDTGAGMPPEMIGKVFEPFFTTKGVGQGTGLGLSQVYGFARSSGGDVDIESEVGIGTTVSLLLARANRVAVEGRQGQAPRAAMAERQCRILVAEDDDRVAELVQEMLEELGYDSGRVPSASDALDMLHREAAFDLVLSDMIMPGEMNGLDLVHAIGEEWPELPIILMTGYSDAAAEASQEGVTLLVKPYTIEALGGALQAALAAG